MSSPGDGDDRRHDRRRRALGFAVVSTVAEAAVLWRRTGKPAGHVIVRCHDGHLFSTLWIPAASLKAVRLGPWRIQRCPVGHHWSLVTPVRESELSPIARRVARRRLDTRIP